MGLWGHDDPEREWKVLDEPIIKIEFDKPSQNLINDIMEKEEVDFETTVSYFLQWRYWATTFNSLDGELYET